MTGSLDLGNNNIVNFKDPTLIQHAATKNYVDTAKPNYLAIDLSNSTSTDLIRAAVNLWS